MMNKYYHRFSRKILSVIILSLTSFHLFAQAPTFNAEWFDIDENGSLDRVTLTFNTPVDIVDATPGAGSLDCILINSGAVTFDANDYSAETVTTLVLNFLGNEISGTAVTSLEYDDTGTSTINREDLTQDEIADATAPGVDTDSAAPIITAAVTIDGGNGFIDGVTLTFSEAIDDGLSTLSNITVAAPYVGETADSDDDDDNSLVVSFTEQIAPNYDTDATPDIDLPIASVSDAGGNAIALGTQTFTGTTDGAAPVAVVFDPINTATDIAIDKTITITFSEDLTDVSADPISLEDITNTTDDRAEGVLGISLGGVSAEDLIINPNADLSGATEYSILVPGTRFSDGTNTIAGFDGSTDYNFTIVGPPTVVAAHFFDTDENGVIDEVVIEVSEGVNFATAEKTDFTLNNGTLEDPVVFTTAANSLDGSDTDQYITFPITGYTAETSITGVNISFANNNSGAELTGNVSGLEVADNGDITELDKAAPVLTAAVTIDGGNGFIDGVTLTFSEAIDDGLSALSNIAVEAPYVGETADTDDDDDNSLVVSFTEQIAPNYDTDATPNIDLPIASVRDAANNAIGLGTQTFSGTTDGAAPVAVVFDPLNTATDIAINKTVTITFSEDLTDTSTGPISLEDITNATDDRAEGVLGISLGGAGTEDLIINPNIDLSASTEYSVLVPGTRFSDGANTLAGFDGSTDYNFTILGPPTILNAHFFDTDENGVIDEVVIEVSEGVNLATAEPADFTLNNGTLQSAVDFTTAANSLDGSDTDQYITFPITGYTAETSITGVTISFANNNAGAELTGNVSTLEVADNADITELDKAAPVITAAVTIDGGNGFIDGVTLTFSEAIDDGLSTLSNITVAAPYVGETADSDDDDDNSLVVSFTEQIAPNYDTDATPNIDLPIASVRDAANNAIGLGTQTFSGTTDGAAPAIISAVTGDDGDGELDEIVVTLSEDIDPATVDITGAADFSVADSYVIASAAVTDTDEVTLTITPKGVPDTGETPNVVLGTGDIQDIAPGNNSLSSPQTFTGTTDGAAPVISSVSITSGNAYIRIVFSEPVANSDGNSPVDRTDFAISNFTNNGSAGATGVDIDTPGVTDDSDAALGTGGWSVLRVLLDVTGFPDTDDQFQIGPNGVSALYDVSGNAMSGAELSSVATLDEVNPSDVPQYEWIYPNTDNSIIYIKFTVPVDGKIQTGGGGNFNKLVFDDDGSSDDINVENFLNNGSGVSLDINDQTLDPTSGSDDEIWELVVNNITGGTADGGETYTVQANNDKIYNRDEGNEMLFAFRTFSGAKLADETAEDFDNAVATAYDTDDDGNIDAVTIVMPDGVDDSTVEPGDFLFNTSVGQTFSTGTPLAAGTANDNTFTIGFTDYVGTAVVGTLDYDNTRSGTKSMLDDAEFSTYEGIIAGYDGTRGNVIGDGDLTLGTGSAGDIVDAAGPIVTSVTTLDTEPNGSIDRVAVLFSEPIFDVATAFTSFVLDGGSTYTPNGFAISGSTINVDFLEPGGFDTDAGGFNVEIDPGIVDDAAGALNPDQTGGNAVAVTDGAAPYGTVDALATTDDTPPITGTVDDPNASVLVNIGSQTVGAVNGGAGTWSVADNTFTALATVSHEVTAILIDPFGNTGFDVTSDELDISAGVTITAPNFSQCLESGYATFDGPIIFTESDPAGIASSGTITLLLPVGFEFNTAITPTTNEIGAGDDIDMVTYSYPSDERLTITITLESSATDESDEFEIGGLQVRAVGSTPYSNVKMIRSGGTASISTNSTDFANLTSLDILPTLTAVQETVGATFITEYETKFLPTFTVAYIFPTGTFTGGEVLTFSGGAIATIVPGSNTGSAVDLYITGGTSTSISNGETFFGPSTGTVNGAPTKGSDYLEPFTFIASPSGTEAQWWNVQTNSLISNISTRDNTALGMTTDGLYSFDIYDYNGTCLNEPLRVKVLINNDTDTEIFGSNTFEDKNFITTDEAYTFYLSNPVGHTVTVTGAATTVTNPSDTKLLVTFDPSIAGEDPHIITYTIINNLTGDQIVQTVTFGVSLPAEIFSSVSLPNAICVSDLPYSVTFATLQPGQTLNFIEFDNFTVGQSGFWYRYDNNNFGAPSFQEQFGATFPYTFNLDPRPSNGDIFTTWSGGQTSNSPFDVPDGQGVAFRIYLSLNNPSIVIQQNLFLYGAPIVNISNINTSYCYDDGPFTLEREATYVDDWIATNPGFVGTTWSQVPTTETQAISTGYELHKETFPGSGIYALYEDFTGNDLTGNGFGTINVFEPDDPDQDNNYMEDESGNYRIIYISEGLSDGLCSGNTFVDVIIDPIPADPQINLSQGLIGNGGGDPWYDLSDVDANGLSTIVLEYCGNTDFKRIFADQSASLHKFYTDAGGTDEIDATGNGFIDNQNFQDQGGLWDGTTGTFDFYFSRIINGCESNIRKVSVYVYDETDIPVPVTSVNNEDVEPGQRYVYEFCDSYSPITLNTLDINGSDPNSENPNAYFRIYQSDAITPISEINSSALNAVDFGGVAAAGATKTIFISQVWNDAEDLGGVSWLNLGSPFFGCESALVQLDITVFSSPSNAGAVDAPSLGGPEIHICKGEAFADVLFSSLGIDEYVFREAGKGIVLTVESGGVLNIDDLQNSASDFNRSNVGIYNYGLSRISNIGTETDFPGCESGTINFSVEVHEIYDEVDIVSLDYSDNDSDATDYLYEVCLSELDQNDFLSVSSSTPTLNKEFLWYSTDLNGDNEVPLSLVNSESPTFQDLGMGLGDVADGNIKYFEVTQRTDIDDFEGCEGPPVFIKVTFSDLAALTVNMPGADNDYCYDEEADFSMILLEDGTPVGPANVTLYEVRLAGTSTIIDLDPGAGETLATGTFAYPIADLDLWLVAGGGDADLIGGSTAILDVYFEYLHPTLGCTGTHIETLSIFPKPDITFTIADQDISLVDFDDDAGTDYDEFCYDDGDILLEGLFADGTGLTKATGGQFVIVQNADDDFSAESDDILLSTNNNRAFFNTATQHGPDQFLAQTSHLIQFEYQDDDGCDNFVEQIIFVNPRPEASGVLNTSQIQFTQICEGEITEAFIEMFDPGTSTPVSDYTGYTFDWNTSGVSQPQEVNSNTIVFNVPVSTISFEVLVTDPNGCQVTINESHTKSALPVLTIPAIVDNQEFCSSNPDIPLVLMDGGVSAAIPNISWSVESYSSTNSTTIPTFSDTGTNPTIDMAAWHVAAGGNTVDGFGDIVGGPATIHTITMTYQDNTRSYQGVLTQCSNTIVRTITINPLPDISFDIQFLNELEAGYTETFCYDPELISLQGIFADGTDLTGGSGSFSGPGVVPTGNSLATWNPITAHGSDAHKVQTGYDITFTYTDPNGCQYAVIKTLNVTPLPDPIEIGGGFTADNQIHFTAICVESPITAEVNLVGSPDYSNYSFDWTLPFGSTGAAQTLNAITFDSDISNTTPNKTFSIGVVVTNSITGCSFEINETHAQQALPVLNFDNNVISDLQEYCQEDADITLDLFTNTGQITSATDLSNLSYSVTSTGSSSNTFGGAGNPTIDFDQWHQDAGGSVVGGSATTHTITMTYEDVSFNQYQNLNTNCSNTAEVTILIYPKPIISFTYEGDNDDDDNEVCIDESRLTLVSSLVEQTGQTVSTFSVANFASTALEDNNDGTADIAIEQLFLDAIAGGVLDDSGATASRSSRSITVDIDLFYEDGISCTNIVTQTVMIHNLPVPVFDITQNGSSLVSGTLVEVCIDDLSEVNALNLNKILLTDVTNQVVQGTRTAASFTEDNYNLGAASLENIGTTGQAYFYPRAAVQAAEGANSTLVGATSIDFVFDMSYTNEFGCVGKTKSSDAEAGVQDFDNRLTIRVYRTPKPVIKVDFNGFALTENDYCIDQDIVADPIRLFVESIGFDTGAGSGGTFISDPPLSTAALYGAVVNNDGYDEINFNPALAYDEHPNANTDNGDVAVFEVSYVYNTSDKSCANVPSTSVVTITINPKPFVEFIVDSNVGTARNEFCIDNDLKEIQGFAYSELSQTNDISDLGQGRFTSNFTGNPGVIATTNNLADFNFQSAYDDQEERTHTVIYTYTKTSTGCFNSVSQDIIINTKPIVDINSVGGCDRTPVELVFTTIETAPGDQVVGASWDFDDLPSEKIEIGSNTSTDIDAKHPFSEAGEYFVTLVATSEKGCSSVEVTEQIQVGDIPDVNFTVAGLCEDSEILFEASPTSVDVGTVEYILFDYGDGSPKDSIKRQGNQDKFALDHIYTDPGVFTARLILVTNNDCEQIHNRTINILPKKLVTSENPYFEDFESVVPSKKDYLELVYNELNLSRDTTDNFENGVIIEAAGWSADLRPLEDKDDVDYWGKLPKDFNSWQFGVPTGMIINNNESDHGNVWATNLDGNYSGEEAISWVHSPCFNFTDLERPMVSFDQSYNFPDTRDGVVLQYSVDGGASWLVLGDYNSLLDDATGIKWFTDQNIIGVPGEQSGNIVGWSGNQDLNEDTPFAEWVSSRHKLDEIPTDDDPSLSLRASVIFRFALGSDESVESEGFAFDNFRIDERKKNVLLEQFSSTNSNDSKTVAESIEDIINDETINKGDIIAINYHTSFAGEHDNYQGNPPILQNPDPVSILNLEDPSARTAYYGIATAPNSVLDGDEGISDGATAKTLATDILWDKNDIARNSLKDAKFDIVIDDNFGSEEGVIDVNVVATAQADIEGGEETELAVYIAIIEKDVDISAGAIDRNGQTVTYNALRKMLPSGIGSRYDQAFPTGTSLNVTETWDISKDVDASDLAIVAFVQDVETKVIYQTVTKDVVGKTAPTITGIGDGLNNEGYNLYPNPANREVFIVFGKTTIEVMDWSVYDQTGKVYKLGKLKPGAGGFSLETGDFPSGMYFISIAGENLKFNNSKFIITH